MRKFVTFHAFTPYTNANINYGEGGLPKMTHSWGTPRPYQSSQSKKSRSKNYDGKGSLSQIDIPVTVQSKFLFEMNIRRPLEQEGIDPDLAYHIALLSYDVATGNNPVPRFDARVSKFKEKSAKVAKLREALESCDESGQAKARKALALAEGDLADCDSQNIAKTEEVLRFTNEGMDQLFEEVALKAAKEFPVKKLRALLAPTDKKGKKSAGKSDMEELPRLVKTKYDAFVKKVSGERKPSFRSKLQFTDGYNTALYGSFRGVRGALYVNHSYTIHRGQINTDLITAMDELQEDIDADNRGAGHMTDGYFNSGLYYSLMVLDLHHLEENLSGFDGITEKILAAEIERCVHVMATPPLGAKANSTAPFLRSPWVMVEVGDVQPCTLDMAFIKAVEFEPDLLENGYRAVVSLCEDLWTKHADLGSLQRAMMAMGPVKVFRKSKAFKDVPLDLNTDELAQWAVNAALKGA